MRLGETNTTNTKDAKMKNFETVAEIALKEMTVIRETEKAVMVNVFDGNAHVTNYKTSVWFPKSQIEIVDGKVVKMAGWLAKEKGIPTEESVATATARQDAALNNYFEFVESAKKAGVAGIRKGMKKATIIAKAKEQGIAL